MVSLLAAPGWGAGWNSKKPKKTRKKYTGIKKTRVGHQIPDDSPLLRYRDFGDDCAVTCHDAVPAAWR